MSLAIVSEINRQLRLLGITVHEWPGWQDRGNGQVSDYEGGIVHHTASPYGFAYQGLVSGRSDLAGPLCNWAGNEDGSLTVIAAHPANHAGASGGRSMGPLPVTTTFNRRVLGLEIVYPGTSPMRQAQYRTAQVWARIVADVVGGGNIECVRAHAETSVTGKWDPGYAPGQTIDMAAFRRGAATGIIVEDDMDGNTPITFGRKGMTLKFGDWLGETWDGAQVGAVRANAALAEVRAAQVELAALKQAVAALQAGPTPTVDLDVLADKVAARLSALRFEAGA